MINSALSGFGSPAESFILPGMIGEHNALEMTPFDQAHAIELLEAEGWTLEEGANIRTNGGSPLQVTITALATAELVKTAEELQRQWLEIGVDVAIEAVSSSDLQNVVLKNRDYEILLSGELYGIEPDPYAFWHSSQTTAPGLNIADFSSGAADALIETGRNTTDADERAQAYRDLQELVLAERAALFLYQPSYTYAQGAKINHNGIAQIIIPADRFANIHEWYIRSKFIFGSSEEEVDIVEEIDAEDTALEEDITEEE